MAAYRLSQQRGLYRNSDAQGGCLGHRKRRQCLCHRLLGRPAYLAQSPQFYKQIMVGVFERVFEVAASLSGRTPCRTPSK